MMNPQVKAIFLEALRSGEYVSYCGALRPYTDDEPDKPKRRCCIGVLEECAVRHKVISKFKDEILTTSLPSDATATWAGLSNDECGTLADLNDSQFDVLNNGYSFDKVINYIEENL